MTEKEEGKEEGKQMERRETEREGERREGENYLSPFPIFPFIVHSVANL